MTQLFAAETVASLLVLTALELVLGIDNVIFLALLVDKLPPDQRARARRLGLVGAMTTRIGLLLTLSWLTRLTAPLVVVAGRAFSGRDLVLLAGGLFLIGKAAHEIHGQFAESEGGGGAASAACAPASARARRNRFLATVAQIAVLDIVFSLDSVIAAVGMARRVEVMAAAVVLAACAMLFCARAIGEFVGRHPSMRVLALSFLLLIGVLLVADSTGQRVDKGYVYFAMAFAFGVELVNLRLRAKASERRAPSALLEPASRASQRE